MKYNFNYKETYLIEGFFDDLEDDLDIDYSEEVRNTVLDMNDNIIIKQITELFDSINEKSKSWSAHTNVTCRLEGEILYLETEQQWAFHISLKAVPEFEKVLYILSSAGYKGITTTNGFTIGERSYYKEGTSPYTPLDFHNILIINGVYLQNIQPKNLVVPFRTINYNISPRAVFIRCDMVYSDTIQLNCGNISLEYCVNIKDYSFCKKINSTFTIFSTNQSHLASTLNFTGLPTGSYNVNVSLCSKDDFDNNPKYGYNGINTLVGIPNTINLLNFNSFRYPGLVLQHISLEGLTELLIDKAKFKFERFSKGIPVVVLIGPYKTIPKIRSYKIPKSILLYVVKSHDYYIDCYKESEGPHKEYNPLDINDKLLKSALDKQERKELSKADKEEMLLKMIDLGIKYLTPGSNWISKSAIGMGSIKILSATLKMISIYYDRNGTAYPHEKRYLWNDFFKFIKQTPRVYRNKNYNGDIVSLIITPVIEEYKQIKQDRRAQKKVEKVKLKKDNKINDVQPEVTTTVTQPVLKKKSNIEIVDYSEKSIAIFGNTYAIKDKIKEIGGKFNPYLKYNETEKRPGWIISKKKQKEIEDLIK